MKIIFSRHAKKRMKLYSISEKTIDEIISKKPPQKQGKNIIIQPVEGIRYPVKVIANRNNDTVFIIIAYPLKRGAP